MPDRKFITNQILKPDAKINIKLLKYNLSRYETKQNLHHRDTSPVCFLSGRAQQPRIDELECRNLKIGYEKTLHMIFPTPVKYLNMGDENIIGEVIQVCPSVIRLKSTVRDFKGETNLSVVTEDSRYYTYCISFDEGAQAVYKEGGTMPETAVLPVSDEKLTHVIYPEKSCMWISETPPYRWRKRRM